MFYGNGGYILASKQVYLPNHLSTNIKFPEKALVN